MRQPAGDKNATKMRQKCDKNPNPKNRHSGADEVKTEPLHEIRHSGADKVKLK